MEKEIWLPITSYEWIYEVSNLWNIKSLKRNVYRKNWRINPIEEKKLKPRKTWNSLHYRVSLQKCDWKSYKYLVHRLVYCVFNWLDIKEFSKDNQILHKNDLTRDNRLDNLYKWTQSENMYDRYNNAKIKDNILIK